jgi:hypothetical protein
MKLGHKEKEEWIRNPYLYSLSVNFLTPLSKLLTGLKQGEKWLDRRMEGWTEGGRELGTDGCLDGQV